jgi:hypothetical protein
MTVGGAAAIINAIPAFGQVTYVGAIAAGAAIGTFATGRKMFSETDCNKDPVRGFYACCNISNLSNIQAYRAEIGQEMWTENFPYVSTCMQGNKPFEADSWLEQRFLDDAWSDPVKRLCAGFVEPTDIAALLAQLPHLRAIGTTGEKATETICATLHINDLPKVNTSVPIPALHNADGEQICLWRLPSSSRAYPLAFDKKVEAYRRMFSHIGLQCCPAPTDL